MSLAAFVIRRVLWAIPVLLLVMLLTFLLMRGAGGSPFEPPEGVPGLPAPLQQELTDFYNLDEPWFVEFATYVRNVVTLEFGPSLVNRDHSVDEAVKEGFPVTAELILLASAWAIALEGITFGRLWLVFLPSLAIAVFAIAANVFADGLGDVLDPRRWSVVRGRRGRADRRRRPAPEAA